MQAHRVLDRSRLRPARVGQGYLSLDSMVSAKTRCDVSWFEAWLGMNTGAIIDSGRIVFL